MLEAQRVMAPSQFDVARSFYPLFGEFGPLELEPRRVGGPTRHGALPTRRGALVLPPFGQLWHLWAGATSCWRPNATWRTPNTTWRTRFAPFWAVLTPLGWSHVVLEAQHDMAEAQYDVARSNTILHRIFLGLLTQKSTSELSQRWRALRLFGFLFA